MGRTALSYGPFGMVAGPVWHCRTGRLARPYAALRNTLAHRQLARQAIFGEIY